MTAPTETTATLGSLADAQHRLQRQERRLALVLMTGVKGVGKSEEAANLNASIAELRTTIEAMSSATP